MKVHWLYKTRGSAFVFKSEIVSYLGVKKQEISGFFKYSETWNFLLNK